MTLIPGTLADAESKLILVGVLILFWVIGTIRSAAKKGAKPPVPTARAIPPPIPPAFRVMPAAGIPVPPPPPRRPVRPVKAARAARQPPAPPPPLVPARATGSSDFPEAPSMSIIPVTRVTGSSPPSPWGDLFSPASLRTAIILTELLDAPPGLPQIL